MRHAALILALLLVFAAPALAQDEPPQEPLNKTCPVMEGEEVIPDLYVDYLGIRVWFCCEDCPDKFLADPERYLPKLPQFADLLAERAAAAAAAPAAPPAGAPEAAPAEAEEGHEAEGDEDAEGEEGEEHEGGEHPLGILHPLFVHFPIALTVAAFLAAILGLVFRFAFLKNTRTFLIVLAALFVVPTYLLGGEAEEAHGRMSQSLHELVETHETWGTIALATLLGVALLEILHRFLPDTGWLKWLSFLGIVAGAVVVGLTGFYGAEITHGANHLKALLEYLGMG